MFVVAAAGQAPHLHVGAGFVGEDEIGKHGVAAGVVGQRFDERPARVLQRIGHRDFVGRVRRDVAGIGQHQCGIDSDGVAAA